MVNRTRERGVAIFIVIMVLTMLSAIGVFAMRATSLATLASGYERQSTQNHYVGEYAMIAAATEIGVPQRVKGHICKMRHCDPNQPVETCLANLNIPNDGGVLTCEHIYAVDIQRYSTAPLFVPAAPPAPGSLGPTPLEGDFDVEATDLSQVLTLVPGEDLTKSKSRYWQVTLTSTGQVRPTAADGGLDPASCAAAGNETGRAHVVIGPVE